MIAILISTTNVTDALHTLESPIREASLKPLNYNPHPYEKTHYTNHHTPHQAAINLNSIDSDYIENSIYYTDLKKSLQARHPLNSIYRFCTLIIIKFPIYFPHFKLTVKHHINFRQLYRQVKISEIIHTFR